MDKGYLILTRKGAVSLLLFLAFGINYMPYNVLAQVAPTIIQWDRTYGGSANDYLFAIRKTSDKGFMLGGHSRSNTSGDKSMDTFGGSDYWVIKIDSAGKILWQRDYGGIGDIDYLMNLNVDADNGYLFAGYSESGISGNKTSNSFGGYDFWLIKTDSVGNSVWQKNYGGTGLESMQVVEATPDGGYIIGGWSPSGINGNKTSPHYGDADNWILKLDSFGNIEWQQSYGGSGREWMTHVGRTTDGGYVMGGWSSSSISGVKTENSRGGDDYWVVKVDSVGNIQWQRTLGGSGDDRLNKMDQTNDGGYILVGASWSPASGDKSQSSIGGSDYWIVKLDALGSIVWQKTLVGNNHDEAHGMLELPNGNIIVGGSSNSTAFGDKTENGFGLNDGWIIAFDPNGNILWDKTIGGSGAEHVESFEIGHDTNIVVALWSTSDASCSKFQNCRGGWDYWLVKLGPPPSNINTFIAGDTTPCFDAKIKYYLTPFAGNRNVTWTLPQGWTLYSGQGTDTIYVRTGLNPGHIIVTITGTSCNPIPTHTDTLFVNPSQGLNQVQIQADHSLICTNVTNTILRLGNQVPIGSSIVWGPQIAIVSLIDSATVLVNPSSSLQFFVTVTNGVCIGKDTITLSIDTSKNQLKVVPANPTICLGSGGIQLTASGYLSYAWTPATGLNSTTIANPQANPTATTTYQVIGTNASGCADTATVTVTVDLLPPTPQVTTPIVCAGNSVRLSANGSGIGANYLWFDAQTGGNVLASGATFQTGAILSDTVFYVQANMGNCSSARLAVNINPAPLPDATFTALSDSCELRITLNYQGNGQGIYDLGNGQTLALNGPLQDVKYTQAGSYTIRLMMSQNGCSDEHIEQVTLSSSVEPIFSYHQDPCSGEVTFQFQGPASTSVSWNLGDGTIASTTNVNHTYTQSGAFQVQLTTNPGLACEQTSTQTVSINAGALGLPFLSVPNAFSPNEDGVNDEFLFQRSSTTCLDFKYVIYDRWGLVVFEGNANDAWDGTYNNSQVPEGVYVFVIELIKSDGSTFTRSGTVAVLR